MTAPRSRTSAPEASPSGVVRWGLLDDARLAVVFLTRLPLPLRCAPPEGAHARAMAWFPVVGALIGLAGAAVHGLALAGNLPPAVAALLALGATIWITGALHEDGLADVADGLGGGRDRDRKLEIMRDSRVGTYGVLALLLSVGLRAAALATPGDPWAVATGLAAAAALSRGLVPMVPLCLAPARRDGLAAGHGRPPRGVAIAAVLLGVAIAGLMLGWAALPATTGALLAVGAIAWLAARQIQGYTGDVLGAAQQASECAILLVVVAIR